MKLDKFTIKGQEALLAAQQQAETYEHPQLEPEHLAQKMAQMLFEPPKTGSKIWELLDKDGLPSVSRFVAAAVRARTGT